jgi:hypothetical protein
VQIAQGGHDGGVAIGLQGLCQRRQGVDDAHAGRGFTRRAGH